MENLPCKDANDLLIKINIFETSHKSKTACITNRILLFCK